MEVQYSVVTDRVDTQYYTISPQKRPEEISQTPLSEDELSHLDWILEQDLTIEDYRKAKELGEEGWRELAEKRAVNMASGILEVLLKQAIFENKMLLSDGSLYSGGTRLLDLAGAIDVDEAKAKTDGRYKELTENLKSQLTQSITAIEEADKNGARRAAIVTSPQMTKSGHHVVQIFLPEPGSEQGVVSFYIEFRGSEKALAQFIEKLENRINTSDDSIDQYAALSQAGIYTLGKNAERLDAAGILEAAKESLASEFRELQNKTPQTEEIRLREIELKDYLDRFSLYVRDPQYMQERQERLVQYIKLILEKAPFEADYDNSTQQERSLELATHSLPEMAREFLHQDSYQQEQQIGELATELERLRESFFEKVSLGSVLLDNQSVLNQLVGVREQILHIKNLTKIDRAVTLLLDNIVDSQQEEQRVSSLLKLEQLLSSAMNSLGTDPALSRLYISLKLTLNEELAKAAQTKRILDEIASSDRSRNRGDLNLQYAAAQRLKEEDEERLSRMHLVEDAVSLTNAAQEAMTQKSDAKQSMDEIPPIFRRAGIGKSRIHTDDRALKLAKQMVLEVEREGVDEQQSDPQSEGYLVRQKQKLELIEPEEPLPYSSTSSTALSQAKQREDELVKLAKNRELTSLYKFLEKVQLPVVQIRRLLKQAGLDDALVEMIVHIYQSRIEEGTLKNSA